MFVRPTKPKKTFGADQAWADETRLTFPGFCTHTQRDFFCKTENEEQVFYPKH